MTSSAELDQEMENAPLSLTGEIPEWLSGTLVRNGPITVKVDGVSNAQRIGNSRVVWSAFPRFAEQTTLEFPILPFSMVREISQIARTSLPACL